MKRIDALRPMIYKISLIIFLFAVVVLMNFSMPVILSEVSEQGDINEDLLKQFA